MAPAWKNYEKIIIRQHACSTYLLNFKAFVAAIMKIKARAGIIFRNCEKSNDGNPQNRW